MKEVCRCALCDKLIYFEDSYSPADDAICAECDTEVTGREHAPSIAVLPEHEPVTDDDERSNGPRHGGAA